MILLATLIPTKIHFIEVQRLAAAARGRGTSGYNEIMVTIPRFSRRSENQARIGRSGRYHKSF